MFVSLIFRRTFSFVLLLDRTRMLFSIQLYSVFVQDSEHGTSTTETAGFPYFIDWMTGCIEVNDCFLSIHTPLFRRWDWRELHYHSFLKLWNMLGRFAKTKASSGSETHHEEYIRWFCLWKQLIVRVDAVMDADNTNDFTRQNSRNIASSRAPRMALLNLLMTSSSPRSRATISCFHSGRFFSSASFFLWLSRNHTPASTLDRLQASRSVRLPWCNLSLP